MNAAQKRFDETYITASEVMEYVGVNRTSLHFAREQGRLPEPIFVKNRIFIWERATTMPYLDAWKKVLQVRRGV